jgi:hypothetical protein
MDLKTCINCLKIIYVKFLLWLMNFVDELVPSTEV